MDEAQRGQKEEEGSSVGGRDRDGVPGAWGELRRGGLWRRWGPDDRSVDAPLLCFGGGGGSLSHPPSIVVTRGGRWLGLWGLVAE